MRGYMRMAFFFILTLGLALPEVLIAESNVNSPIVNHRQRKQHRRIRRGVKSGELTKDEAQRLRSEQKGIQQEKRDMKSDGTVTRDERKQLRDDQNAASKDIYEEKHDAEKQ